MLRPTQDRDLAINLRKQSKSYSEIYKLTGIPKSTLSDWLSNEDWSTKIKSSLTKENKKYYSLNLSKALKTNAKIKNLRDEKFLKEASDIYSIYRQDPLFLSGLNLYWGEGAKRSHGCVSVTNTDPNMLRIIANFYRKYLKVSEDKLRVSLFLYKDLDAKKAIDFWSTLLNIPENQFIKTRIVKSRTHLATVRYKYGVCTLYFSNTEFHTKILEWIRLLSLDLAGLA
ncbi:MAG: hypothetical protein AAB546_01975 [Patescibacteria group bacterium]